MSTAPSAETIAPTPEPAKAGEDQVAVVPEPSAKADFSRDESARSRQWVTVALCLLLTGWAGYRWGELSSWGQQELEIQRQPAQEYAYRVDLNRANWIELALLEGIGEILGKKIVADRDENGPYASVDDLTRVNGIGEKKLSQFRRRLYVEPAPK